VFGAEGEERVIEQALVVGAVLPKVDEEVMPVS
jgi:hypothetical protein